MTKLIETFTSTGSKFFAHQEAMSKLKNGVGQPITSHVMCTDVCQHSCAFCSVHHRAGDVLPIEDIFSYLDILQGMGLKAVILSGGGNPILYRCPKTLANINDLVGGIHARGLEIGLITNGMPLRRYEDDHHIRESWGTVRPETLDKCDWVRISMAGLDHAEEEVFVPDIDPSKTTLGFSYVGHDIFYEPADKAHGKVSTTADLLPLWTERLRKPTLWFEERVEKLTEQIGHYVRTYKPRYVRLLPNCLEPSKIDERCRVLQIMADRIDPGVVFVQHKPPAAPRACYLGYVHPVLNTDGYVYPCDSVTLAVAEVGYRHNTSDHKFASPWAICHWSEIAKIYDEPVRSLIEHPQEMCRGCVFSTQNAILEGVRDGTIDPVPPATLPEHSDFV